MFQNSIPEAPAVPPQTTPVLITRSASGLFAIFWSVQGWGLILLTFMSFFPRLFHIEEYLFFTLLVAAVVAAWAERRSIWVRTPIDLPLLLFVGWVLVTTPFATDPAYSFSEWRKLVAQVLVFYWVLLVIRHQNYELAVRQVQWAVIAGAAVLSINALFGFVERGGSLLERVILATGPSSDSNWLSTYLIYAIPIAASAALTAHAWWMRMVCASASILAILVHFITYMRAGWLGLVAESIAVGLFIRRPRVVLWAVGGSLVFAVTIFALSRVGYYQKVVTHESLLIRFDLWKVGVKEIMTHPFVGQGYGERTTIKLTLAQQDLIYHIGPPNVGLHSTFLMIAVGSGIPALVFMIALLVKAGKSLIRHAEVLTDRRVYGFVIGVAVMMVGFAVRNFFNYMFAGSLAYLFWILVAAGLAGSGAKWRA